MEEANLYDVIEELNERSPESLGKGYSSECAMAYFEILDVKHLSIYKFLVNVTERFKPPELTVTKTQYAKDAKNLVEILEKLINKYS
jgi:hypothetical protein